MGHIVLSLEEQTAVFVRLYGVGVAVRHTRFASVGIVILRYGVRFVKALAFTVENEFTQVLVRIGRVIAQIVRQIFLRDFLVRFFHFRVLFFHKGLLELVSSISRARFVLYRIFAVVRRRGRRSVNRINLVIIRRRRMVGIDIVGNAHRIVNVGVGRVGFVEIIVRRTLNERRRYVRARIVRIKRAVFNV